MKKILIVSTNEEIDEKIGSYINSEQMPNAEYITSAGRDMEQCR